MEVTLEARSRDTFGKNAARRLRREGWIPAVLYGGQAPGEQPVGHPIAVDPKVLSRILHSESGVNTLIGLQVDGAPDPARVLVREYQLDPISHMMLHADFYRVAMDQLLAVSVPVILRGESRGVKQQGGLVDFVHREIEIECLPADIPEQVVVDITELMLGQSVRVRDLVPDGPWRPTSEPEMMLVHIITPRAEAAPAEEEAAAVATPATPAEPEVIKRGKAEAKGKAEAAEE
jgi:large subunit ribosomal protein L25